MTVSDPMDMAQALMRRLDGIDELFSRQEQERDFSERLGAAALDMAEGAKVTAAGVARLTHRIATVLAVGLLLWTPVVAYGAVWMHERVRNTCYPLGVAQGQADEPWYCGIFPGTNHPPHHLEEPR